MADFCEMAPTSNMGHLSIASYILAQPRAIFIKKILSLGFGIDSKLGQYIANFR
jgi:hypothetical protein